MTFREQLKKARVVAVVCDQWGDTGKGKIIDHLAKDFDIIARGTGGNNAGHTVTVGKQSYIFHLIPSGILHDKEGKMTVMGNGLVIDLEVLNKEIAQLDQIGVTHDHLKLSKDAAVILPWAIERDRMRNESLKDGRIGTTGRGIGPAYGEKILRKGILISDLYDEDRLLKKLELLKLELYPEAVSTPRELQQRLLQHFAPLKPIVADTKRLIYEEWKSGKRILLEGAQGLLLSVEYGTRPYVTSSDPSVAGMTAGVGLPYDAVDIALGLVKFPFMTRVGAGPFPSELGGEQSELHCSEGNRGAEEREQYPNPLDLVNGSDPLLKGIGIRRLAGEYGSTTGRPRRVGWTDLVALKHAISLNGPDLVLTKPDTMRGVEKVGLCVAYEWDGPDTDSPYGKLTKGLRIEYFLQESHLLRYCRPVIEWFDGWTDDLSAITSYRELPESFKRLVIRLEQGSRGKVRMIGTGPEREQLIYKD